MYTTNIKCRLLPSVKRARAAAMVVCVALATPWAFAHEVWIEPLDYGIDENSDFIADTRIGQNFKGSTQYYIAENTLSSGVVTPSEILETDRISGDIPAMKTRVKDPGLHVAWMHTKPDRLHYKTFEKFKKFVTEQGLEEIAQQHLDNDWPVVDFFEAYSRCSKSLLQVGNKDSVDHAQGKDKAIGMPIELVAKANPYQLASGDRLPVQLLWQSEIMMDAQVMIFHKTDLKEVTITTVRTDADGIAMIPLTTGAYLLNAVRIIPWQGEPAAQWHSYWASMTFKISD